MLLPALLRCFFLLSSALVLLVYSVPPFRRRFLPYGKTSTPPNPPPSSSSPQPPSTSPIFSRTLDYLGTFDVPHSWFTHFYVLSIFSSLFWGWQIVTHSQAYSFLSALPAPEWMPTVKSTHVGGQSIEQVVTTWICMFLQGSRRLYECVYVSKQGTNSRMWVVHYALGLFYYVAIGVSVWIEGTDAIRNFDFALSSLFGLFGPPSAKSFFGILLFITASGLQHDCHIYLASLVKYTLPIHPAFERLVCPHYFAECLIYVALSVLAAPRGSGVINWTLWTGLVFVVVNLGVASLVNREWYERKFGKKAVERRWNMIPFVF